MVKEEICPGIIVYSNVIPDSDLLCEEIEKSMIFAQIEWEEASITSTDKVRVDAEIRNTKTIGIPYIGKIQEFDSEDPTDSFYIDLANKFFENFDIVEKDYLDFYGIGSAWHAGYYLLKYGKDQFFINHIDDQPEFHRRVSTVYYLNDEYTGGEISFPRFNIKFKPKANQMIIFPSTYVYNHSVSPVVEGKRYAVASWLK